MDLVDRYVKAVAKALPEAQREDISRELSEDIRSEIEDMEKELGRPLTRDEQETLLKKRGNPLLVAARYRQDQRSVSFGRQIIGPVLYPFYIRVLSFNLGLTFLVVAIIFAALAVSGQKIGFHYIVSTCLLQLFIQLGVVTLIFSLVQKHLTKHPDRWHLQGMGCGFALDLNIERDIEQRIGREAKGWGREVSRFESISIIVASAVAIAWITGVQNYPFLMLGPASFFLKLAPIWYQIYFPILMLTVAEIVRAIINLARPDWVLFRLIYRLILHACGLGVAYMLLKAGVWVMAANEAVNAGRDIGRTVEVVNQVFYYGVLGAFVLSAGMLVFRIVDVVQRWRYQGGSRGVGAAANEGNQVR
ncbi:MAG TPA: hypothetical protein VE077_21295 [Candidatus Methylomirabilis sp.]|nr:hypothetical protein [Candidatus Methylomirabilis sp.]